jgi:hypothetical protein
MGAFPRARGQQAIVSNTHISSIRFPARARATIRVITTDCFIPPLSRAREGNKGATLHPSRHLNESQRAMVGAKLANMPIGAAVGNKYAAKTENKSENFPICPSPARVWVPCILTCPVS